MVIPDQRCHLLKSNNENDLKKCILQNLPKLTSAERLVEGNGWYLPNESTFEVSAKLVTDPATLLVLRHGAPSGSSTWIVNAGLLVAFPVGIGPELSLLQKSPDVEACKCSLDAQRN